MIPAGLRAAAEAWLAGDCDPADSAELRRLIDEADVGALETRFAGPLRFGTAGLRGPMRAGPNGMNSAVVRRTSAGVADWLRSQSRAGGTVVVGYDARHRSRSFAESSAGVFAATGFDARLLPGPLPTPVLAFAARTLSAAAAVMITASHNCAADNGYKLYDADAAQIIPPADAQVEAAIQRTGPANRIATSTHVPVLDEALVREYVGAVAALVPARPRALRIVYTPLHGVGAAPVRAVLTRAGFPAPEVVAEQQRPDPDFPTVAHPNPERPGTLKLAMALAERREADLVLATDPDADRCAVAVPDAGRWRMLAGDEVGALLADAMLRRGVAGTYATTIVSTDLLAAMTARHGAGYRQTPTGFKWIMRAAPDLVFGYEEALGYAVAPQLVRDKDGISAALLVADLADELRTAGSSLSQRLADIAGEYGHYRSAQRSRQIGDAAAAAALMARLRAHPPPALLGCPAEATDLLPATDAVRVTARDARVVVRPSGTEPMVKAYLQVYSEHSAETAERRLRDLAVEADRWLAG